MKPKNTYKPGTVIYEVLQGSLEWPEGGWIDLTVPQIAEVLSTTESTVCNAIRRIKREKGYWVPHAIPEKGAQGE